MLLGLILGVFALRSAPEILPTPAYPPNTIGGGTVVALLRLSSGSVTGVQFLSGGEPFTNASQEALSRWKLNPKSPLQRLLVVVMFRNPNYYAVGGQSKPKAPAQRDASLPFPNKIIEPSYLPNATGAGSVILKVEVSAQGKVDDVSAIQEFGSLTDTSKEAVKHWQFQPAKNTAGGPVPSQAYAVLVFASPILSPAPGPH